MQAAKKKGTLTRPRPFLRAPKWSVVAKNSSLQCDEVRPVCSRCNKRNHQCFYDAAKRDSVGESVSEAAEEDAASQPLMLQVLDPGCLEILDLSPSCSPWSDNIYATDSTTTGSLSPYVLANQVEQFQVSRMRGALSSQELELLSHYITHTSRAIPFDQEDLYALHVGIPNLAFGNEALMASMLALSAACKSHDIIKLPLDPLDRLDEIRELLNLADRHHRTSLHHIRVAVHDTQQYDPVLANAALMVLYGSSSHCVRVTLAQIAKRHGVVLEDELLPTHSQWITLIRAAHTVLTGLLNRQSECQDDFFDGSYLAASEAPVITAPVLPLHEVYSPQFPPIEGTKRFMYSIVSATYRSALDKLAAKVQSTHSQFSSDAGCSVQACSASHQMLEYVYDAVFTGKVTAVSSDSDLVHLSRLHGVSPWLRSYLGRVTSSAASKPLHRTIMAFLNRVPLEYLHLVQSMLDRIPVTGHASRISWNHSMSPPGTYTSLAMDIFAHWLILVMLLDGVWWIGSVGEWELGRILSFAETQSWGRESTEPGDKWWPESMYNVKKELAEHMGRTGQWEA
ncbi:hypothetical protein ED733_001614 [Metarhizium rileyi]|uniref:Zn(2)-C6 fungal-type domain-containing protein n=1 Tax=Metarhizium rileyi (strain RCEF 4871) TaxID=1649241 RepID=A0A5C6G557_METRR|nr:hypothetical protein ED733_001614 [Metarhizium rileyi]